MRRNDPREVRAPPEMSIKYKLLLCFLFAVITIAIIRAWIVIVRQNKDVYESAGALATILVMCLILICARRVILARMYREVNVNDDEPPHQQETPAGNSGDATSSDQALLQLLRRTYGNSLEFILAGGPGLPIAAIETMLLHHQYEALLPGAGSKGVQLNNHPAEPAADAGLGTELPIEPSALVDCDCCSDTTCAVCLCEFCAGDPLITLPCSHSFHQACITPWLLARNLCPLCKRVAVQQSTLLASLNGTLDASNVTPRAGGSPSRTNFLRAEDLSLHSSRSQQDLSEGAEVRHASPTAPTHRFVPLSIMGDIEEGQRSSSEEFI